MLDRLLAVTVKVVLLAGDVHREEISLLEGLDEILLVL